MYVRMSVFVFAYTLYFILPPFLLFVPFGITLLHALIQSLISLTLHDLK